MVADTLDPTMPAFEKDQKRSAVCPSCMWQFEGLQLQSHGCVVGRRLGAGAFRAVNSDRSFLEDQVLPWGCFCLLPVARYWL
jgi:hypothetical protein